MREACRSGEGNPGYELGRAVRRGLARGPRQDLHRRHRPGRGRRRRPRGLRLGVGGFCRRRFQPLPFGLWAEQLIAESTGKQGKGLVPAPGESPDGTDRQRRASRASPIRYALGAEFFRWEFAIAVAGTYLEIDPFDQPDVQAAKDKTNEVLATGEEPALEPEGSVDELLAQAHEGDYVCVQAFVNPDTDLGPLVDRLRRRTSCVVTHGYGPRYLHSTGQLHKGGPNTGLFLQVVDDPGEELPIPGKPFGFRRLIRAQAAGDFESLKERGRRVARVQIGGSLVQLGMVGLGRMGANMTERLRAAGHDVKTFDPNVDSRTASSLEELVQQLDAPRSVWLMVPAGIVDSVVGELAPHLGGGRHDRRRRELLLRRRPPPLGELRERGIHYVDVGVSGGVWGRERGYCMMVGGDDEAVGRLVPVLEALAPGADAAVRTPGRAGDPAPEEQGWLHCGPSGRGPLREDGPQRDRVRPHAGVRRGPERPQAREHRPPRAGDGRRDDAAARPRPLQVRARRRSDQRGLAPRLA